MQPGIYVPRETIPGRDIAEVKFKTAIQALGSFIEESECKELKGNESKIYGTSGCLFPEDKILERSMVSLSIRLLNQGDTESWCS